MCNATNGGCWHWVTLGLRGEKKHFNNVRRKLNPFMIVTSIIPDEKVGVCKCRHTVMLLTDKAMHWILLIGFVSGDIVCHSVALHMGHNPCQVYQIEKDWSVLI